MGCIYNKSLSHYIYADELLNTRTRVSGKYCGYTTKDFVKWLILSVNVVFISPNKYWVMNQMLPILPFSYTSFLCSRYYWKTHFRRFNLTTSFTKQKALGGARICTRVDLPQITCAIWQLLNWFSSFTPSFNNREHWYWILNGCRWH